MKLYFISLIYSFWVRLIFSFNTFPFNFFNLFLFMANGLQFIILLSFILWFLGSKFEFLIHSVVYLISIYFHSIFSKLYVILDWLDLEILKNLIFFSLTLINGLLFVCKSFELEIDIIMLRLFRWKTLYKDRFLCFPVFSCVW